MTLPHLIAFVCLAAFAATADCAQPTEPRVDTARESSNKGGNAAKSRYTPQPMAPALPESVGGDRYDPWVQTRIDRREARYRNLQDRYELPREVSGDLHRAIEDAQRRHGGKVLSANRLQANGRDLYRVKLLTPNGRVRVVQLPDVVPSQNAKPNESGAEHQQAENKQGEK